MNEKMGSAKKRNWILLRGLIRGSFHWHQFPGKLAQAYPNDEIHLFDLPGNGLRNTDTSPITIQEFTEDIRFLSRRLDNIHLIAISLGGMTVLNWLASHPHEVEHAFIMNTSLTDTGPFYKRLNYWNYPKIVKVLTKGEEVIEKLILELTSNSLKVQEQVLEHNIKMARRYPLNRLNFFRQMIAAGTFRFDERLKDYKNLRLMTCANDRLVHPDNTFNLGLKLGIQPVIHPWAGHDLTLDDPDFVVEYIKSQVSGEELT